MEYHSLDQEVKRTELPVLALMIWSCLKQPTVGITSNNYNKKHYLE